MKKEKKQSICMRCGQPSFPGCCEYAAAIVEYDPEAEVNKDKESVYKAVRTHPNIDYSKIDNDFRSGLHLFVKKIMEKKPEEEVEDEIMEHDNLIFVDPDEE